MLAAANGIDRALRAVALAAVWLMPALAGIIVLDVMTRKLGIFLPVLTSSRLQELQWHLHAILFSLWLGFGYVLNAHPRVDTVQANLSLRRKAWLELGGCVLLALPYCLVIVFYAVPFVLRSYQIDEGSNMPGGIGERWIVKGIFATGLALLLLSVCSMILRLLVFLFGGRLAAEARLPLEEPSAIV